MRPEQGTGEIGNGVDLAVIGGGVVGPVEPPRKFDPVNPVDIGPSEPAPPLRALFPCTVVASVATQMRDAYYPMTSHQRHYRWPDEGIGPVRYGNVWGKSKPPVEVAEGQTVWPLPVIEAIPIAASGPVQTNKGPDTVAVAPVRGMSLRPDWTVAKEGGWLRWPILGVANIGDSKTFILTGTTYDKLGTTPIAGCRVVVFWTENIGVGKVCVVGETVSDGSGNYSIQVTGRPVQVIAYLPGSPDLAGVTRNDLLTGPTSIYMHDPTVADTPGGGGNTYSRSRVVSG